MFSSQFCHRPPSPCRNTSGGPSPPVSITLTSRPRIFSVRVSPGQSTDSQVESSPSAYFSSGRARTSTLAGSDRTCPRNPDTPATVPAAVRLAIDIDSTLHPYWDQLAEIAERRYGVALPYDRQFTWEIPELEPEQLSAIVTETHSAEHVLAAEPYPGAVEAITKWHEDGHFIHITSHRATDAHAHTAQWL